MLPEWSRFITEVKLNRGLKESNFDQLYAYLKQHKVHANENRMMMERFIQPTDDPLALVTNASNQNISTDNLIESLTNTLALLRTSSNARNNATVQDDRVVVQDVRGRYNANNQGRPFQRNNARGNVWGTCTRMSDQLKRPQDSDYFKDKMLLMHAHKNGAVLDEEQLLFLAGEQVTNFDKDVDDLALNVDHIQIYDEAGPSYDSNTPFEYVEDNVRTLVQSKESSVTNDALIQIQMIGMNRVSKNKVAIGYKNPLCLTRAKQVQPALYNGHVLVMSNHARPVVHDSEDTREISEITRKKMLEKMKSPQCVENKVRIAPPDYSKENLLATFAPQRNLTPEQIFWSIDNNNRKKAETLAPKPISALTVYPPNTPVKLVPRILPTKSQVKINLYVLTQLFTEFDKTCKKRITPTGVIEGERGFEQTKRCYLTEVIPFFKTLKEHFAGVQTALFKEVKVMEEIFDQMSDEVDQNVVDKQCAEIVKKNLLIENENLIANCLSNQLLFDVEKSRCLDLEAEMSKVHNESKHISKLEREYLNLQLKYQHLQESFDNNKSQTSQEAPDFNSFFKIKNLEHQIQEKDNVIRDLKVLVSNVNDRSCEPYNANDVTDLLEQNEHLRAEIEKVKQHYKEMFESIKITRTSTNEQTSSLLTQIEDLKAQLEGNLKVATGMYAIDVKPIPHPLKNNKSAYLDYINHLKESVEIVREIVEEARIVNPLDNALNSACRYIKLSQELLEYVIGTCPKEFNTKDNKAASTPLTRKKQVTFNDTCGTSTSNTQKHAVQQKIQQSNVPVIPSTRVSSSTNASISKPRSNTKKNRILPAKSENKMKVEDHPMTNKSVWTKVNRVESSISSKRVVINSNYESVCKTCNKCLISANQDMCVIKPLNSVNATPTVKNGLNKVK
ncbi:hypothetical protein Tco_1281093 [Tanacetum coccineum]